MPITDFTVDTDYEVMDFRETVTLKRRQSDGTFTTVVTCHALRREISQEEMTASYALATRGVRWHLWKDELGPVEPKPQDLIEDGDGVSWGVESVEIGTWRTRYRCVTTKSRG